MSKSRAWEEGLLRLEFLNETFAGLGDATGLRGSVIPGFYYLAFHTADPGDSGNQETHEVDYVGYARAAIPRNNTRWLVTLNRVNPVQIENTGVCTSGAGRVITHFSLGLDPTGPGAIMRSGTMTPNVTTVIGKSPKLSNLTNIVEY